MLNNANIWQFSASSKDLLERCLSAAPFDSQNKWIQKFKISPTHADENDKHEEEKDIESIECMEVNEIPLDIEKTIENEQHTDFFQELVDADPTIHIDRIIDMCLQDISVYSLLLNNLPASSLQKFCNHIFSSNNIRREFLEGFYKYFLPIYLKKENTWLSLDILVKAKECHSEKFQSLVLILLNEKDLSNVLQEFISTLNINELNFFLRSLVDHDISNEMFLHNLYTIYLTYKDCHKDEHIQDYVLKKLTEISDVCSSDKNYGRFLLSVIQNHKCANNLVILEKLVDRHRSAFKRPCCNALSNLRQNI